ncbi:MFS transporter [Streptomyces gobiensis]|uniref:MFS transporter n=1 Tax=Streptomyces gobiensis TaxID=2875706 RepID=UPI001E48E098|nr:MFS transporter [Streptomyces gobiensis]UGY94510.1 MFS transporter [Streptomyces gobiensis]
MKNKRDLGLLTATHGVNDMYQGAIPAMLPFLQSERGYSYALIAGITLAATGLSSLVQPLVGLLADRRPMGWLVTAGMGAAGLGVGLSGLGDAYLWTWFAVAVSGLGLAAYHPAAAMAARGIGGGDTRTMSVFAVGGNIGVAVAPLYVALVLGATGVSGTWLLALPAVVMGAGLLLSRHSWHIAVSAPDRSRPEAAPRPPEHSQHPKPPQPPKQERPDDWRAFGTLSVISVFWSIPFVIMGAFAALYVISRFEVSAATGSATLTAFTAGGVVGTLAGGWSAERWGRLTALRYGYLISALAVTGVVLMPHIAGVLVCVFIYGTVLFVPFAAQVTLAQDYLPHRIGTASGLTLGVTMSAGGLLSPLFGLLADGWGVRPVLATLIGVLLVPAALAWRLPEPRSTPAPAPAAPAGADR